MTTGVDPDILQQVRAILRRDLKLPADAPLAEEMPFFEGEVDLDSLDMLLVLTSIERQFGVRIPNESVGREVFQNVATLTRYVQKHRGAGPSSSAAPARPIDWLSLLPHQPPFRFITRVIEVQPGQSARGIWELNGTEPFFAGHFPGRPIVPGVLIAEALAQLSGLAGPTKHGSQGKLAKMDLRFEHPVAPPAQITLESSLEAEFGPLQSFTVIARFGELVVARGSITLYRGDSPREQMRAENP